MDEEEEGEQEEDEKEKEENGVTIETLFLSLHIVTRVSRSWDGRTRNN